MTYEDINKEHASMKNPFEKCPDRVIRYLSSNKQDEYVLKAGYECETCGYFIMDVIYLNKDYKVRMVTRYE